MENISYDDFKNKDLYNSFIKDNPNSSILNIRTTSAYSAYPISGVSIKVSKDIDEYRVIFYEGLTDDSGMINNILLPSSSISNNDLIAPVGTTYNLEVIYKNFNKNYTVLMYPGISTIQNINIIGGNNYGS